MPLEKPELGAWKRGPANASDGWPCDPCPQSSLNQSLRTGDAEVPASHERGSTVPFPAHIDEPGFRGGDGRIVRCAAWQHTTDIAGPAREVRRRGATIEPYGAAVFDPIAENIHEDVSHFARGLAALARDSGRPRCCHAFRASRSGPAQPGQQSPSCPARDDRDVRLDQHVDVIGLHAPLHDAHETCNAPHRSAEGPDGTSIESEGSVAPAERGQSRARDVRSRWTGRRRVRHPIAAERCWTSSVLSLASPGAT